MKFTDFLVEQRDDLFDLEAIKVDPDRDDVYTVVRSSLPVIVKMAYVSLYLKKQKHKSDDAFEFTNQALRDEIEQLLKHFSELYGRMDTSLDVTDAIKRVAKEFKEPLEG